MNLIRLKAMMRKEWQQIARDPSSIAIAFLMPLLLLLLFGYGVSLDARSIPIGIFVESPDSVTSSFIAAFEQSDYFEPHLFNSIQEADRALQYHQINGMIWLRANFSAQLFSEREAPISIRVNGVDANQARMTQSYIQGAWLSWREKYARSHGMLINSPVLLQYRIWFNPAVISRYYLVPGLIAIIMTLTGSLLTALVVAREWERGTMEALFSTPLALGEFLLGKLTPYFILGMGGMAFSLFLAVFLFKVPFQGSLPPLLLSSALFMLVTLAIGLLISIKAKNQFIAGQTAIIITFLPAFMLSDFIFDIRSMPDWIQWLTYLVPARYLVAILQSAFLAGDISIIYIRNLLPLALMLLALAWVIRRNLHKGLD